MSSAISSMRVPASRWVIAMEPPAPGASGPGAASNGALNATRSATALAASTGALVRLPRAGAGVDPERARDHRQRFVVALLGHPAGVVRAAGFVRPQRVVVLAQAVVGGGEQCGYLRGVKRVVVVRVGVP